MVKWASKLNLEIPLLSIFYNWWNYREHVGSSMTASALILPTIINIEVIVEKYSSN